MNQNAILILGKKITLTFKKILRWYFFKKNYWNNNILDRSQFSTVTKQTVLSLIIFFYKFFFNYIIKIYSYKIEHQSKNKNLFETMIT
jgi:hypothetical protein